MLGLVFVGLLGLAANAAAQEGKVSERIYELRTYTTLPGRLPALHKRFAEHTMKLFEKHGMKNEGYWTPTDEKLKDTVLIYIISHDSMAAAEKSWAAFRRMRRAEGPGRERSGQQIGCAVEVYMTRCREPNRSHARFRAKMTGIFPATA
jgi:hypothetical protein